MLEKYLIQITFGYFSFIVPAVIVSFIFGSHLHLIAYFHFALGILLSMAYLLKYLNDLTYKKIIDYYKQIKLNEFEKILISILLGYLFLSLIYLERGWDALHFYLPNGYYFYLSNYIPEGLNPFSFYPTFKPPLNSLLIAYSYYVSNGMYAYLHSIVFLTGTLIIIFKLSEIIYPEIEDIKYISSLFFLLTPLTYFLVYEFALYQELSLMFFYCNSIYFFIRSNENPKFTYIAGLSMTMAILSKMSGYSLFILIVIIFKIEYIHKSLRHLALFVLSIFLTYKSLFDMYLGIAVVVLILGIFLQLVIFHDDQKFQIPFKEFIISMIIPSLIGLIWLLFMIRVDFIQNFLIETYLSTSGGSIVLEFPSISNPNLAVLENGMRVSFFASIFYIITGSTLVLTWSLFKFESLIKYKTSPFLVSWLLCFTMLWLTFFANFSARYLVPILAPFSILISLSFNRIMNKFSLFSNSDNYRIMLYFTLGSSFLFLFPFLPFRFILQSFNDRIFFYHKNQVLLFIYLILFTTLIVKLFFILSKLSYKHKSYLKSILMIIVVFSLFAVQIVILMNVKGDINEFQSNANYQYRDNYQDLIDRIRNKNIGGSEIIMSYNTPGLEYFIQRTVMDIYLVSGEREFDTSLRRQNFTEAINFIIDRSIVLAILLNENHVFYDYYINDVQSFELYNVVISEEYFSKTYENEEFVLYEYND